MSADHLEYASLTTVRAMAEAGTVATLLPGAHLTLHETRKPPVEMFRELGVPMALATNSNPVSSPTVSPAAQMHLACYLFRLTPEEALRGFTVNSARALGLADRAGRIAVGRAADLAVWDTDDPRGIAYAIGGAPCLGVVKDGVGRTRGAGAGSSRVHERARDELLHWLDDGARAASSSSCSAFARIDTCQSAGRHDGGGRLLPRASSTREGIAHRTEAPQAANAQPDRQLRLAVRGPAAIWC